MDFFILDYVQAHLRCDFLDVFMPFVTRFGDGGIFWFFCTVLLLVFPKTRRAGAAMAAGLVLELILCNLLLKPAVARIRPYDVNTAVQILIVPPRDFSFPSGHTGAAFASAAALFFNRNRGWVPALLLAVLIAFSRLYLYVHYPTDVFAGVIIGILAGWLGNRLICAFMNRKKL